MNESKNISRTLCNTLHCRPERLTEWTYDLWATTPTNATAFFPPGRLKRRRYLSVVVPYVVLASSVFVFFFSSFFLDKSPVFFFFVGPVLSSPLDAPHSCVDAHLLRTKGNSHGRRYFYYYFR